MLYNSLATPIMRTNASHANDADGLAGQLGAAEPLGLPRAPASADWEERWRESVAAERTRHKRAEIWEKKASTTHVLASWTAWGMRRAVASSRETVKSAYAVRGKGVGEGEEASSWGHHQLVRQRPSTAAHVQWRWSARRASCRP